MAPPETVAGSGRSRRGLFVLVIAALLLPCAVSSQIFELELAPIAGGLEGPVFLTQPPGDERRFVVEREGRVRILRDGILEPTPFLDISGRVSAGGERGLLSIAFPPDDPQPNRLFAYYTRASDGAVVVSRFTLSQDADRLDPSSEAVLLVVDQPFSNHNGGQLQFGPDGYLYAAFGDGGSANDPQCTAQRVDTLLGKMVRLDVDSGAGSAPFYGIPADNPYTGLGDPPDEVWASGLRNPWRFSFDRATGDLWIADVGQGEFEEVDVEPAGFGGGSNWGWKYKEGEACVSQGAGCPSTGLLATGCSDPSLSDPLLTYRHVNGNCSITGGYVYRGAAIPELFGDYLYGDFCSGTIWRVSATALDPSPIDTGLDLPQLSSFGEDADGELWVMSLDGTLAKIVAVGQAEPGAVQWTTAEISAPEAGAGVLELALERSGGTTGAAAVRVEVVESAPSETVATEGLDFRLLTDRVEWADAEGGERTVQVAVLDDGAVEQDETFSLRLALLDGEVSLGPVRRATVTVLDDERRVGACTPDDDTLCLNDGRFRVEMTFVDFEEESGVGRADPLTDDTGSFWFFDPDNVEVVIKVLDACAISDRYWVFAAGLTNVATRIEVVDTLAGALRVYENELGTAFAPVQDTAAFATCP